jgi:L-seryl-tRNA(Ser) seleniumtransferase
MSGVLRNLPSVNELLESPPLRSIVKRVQGAVVVSRVRKFLDDFRGQVQGAAASLPTPRELAETIATWISAGEHPGLAPVINATGVLFPPGLGRVPLADSALRAIRETSQDYCNLEIDLASGEELSRQASVERQLTRLTGAEAAVVVNNNAAATLICLAALAAEREVVVSRGQLVEIGDTFRLPEVIRASGAMVREVGTTNATRVADFAEAISERAAALLHVHTSTYAVVGASAQPSLADLVALGRRRQVPVLFDLGTGALVDLKAFGIKDEPTVAESVASGADLVLLSGDKLLGGPSCGIIVGRRALVQKIAQHPWMRIVQPSKLTLAALASTLTLYDEPALAERSIPILALLATPLENLKQRAERMAPLLSATGLVKAVAAPGQASLTGVQVPSQAILSWQIHLTPLQGTPTDLAAKLRQGLPPILGALESDCLSLDLRTVFPRQDVLLVSAFEALAAPPEQASAEATPGSS